MSEEEKYYWEKLLRLLSFEKDMLDYHMWEYNKYTSEIFSYVNNIRIYLDELNDKEFLIYLDNIRRMVGTIDENMIRITVSALSSEKYKYLYTPESALPHTLEAIINKMVKKIETMEAEYKKSLRHHSLSILEQLDNVLVSVGNEYDENLIKYLLKRG